MASKPSVTLTLAGDEKKLTEAFDRVGAASKQMSDKVDSSSKEMVNAGKRFEDLAERSDTVDTRAMGFRDTITGVSDSLKGLNDSSLSTEERLLTLGMGIGDLASGFTNLIIPAIGNLAGALRGGLASAMTFISAHPLLITLGLLAAAVIFLIAQTDWFQTVATRVFNWVGNLARNVFGASVDFVINIWQRVISFFENLPSNIGRALGTLGSFIGSAFKAGVNVLVDSLNFFLDHSINWLINRINDISGIVGIPRIPTIPHIPRMHTGGVVPGEPGTETLIMARAGEHVSAPGQGGGELRVTGTGPLVEVLQAMLTDGDLVLVGR